MNKKKSPKYNFIGGFFMGIYTIVLIAISLSMDAFSLSLAYATLPMQKKDMLELCCIVGIYHFFMPLIGSFLGLKIFEYFFVSPDLIIFIILLFIGLNLIKESFEKQCDLKKMKLLELFLFGFAVSIDSFSVGIGLETITDKHLLSSFIFSICSFLFTWLGLLLGKKVSQLLGKFATFLGGIVLISIGIIMYIK